MGPVYLLQLYLAAGVLRPGPKKLSCSVAGKEYYAGTFASTQVLLLLGLTCTCSGSCPPALLGTAQTFSVAVQASWLSTPLWSKLVLDLSLSLSSLCEGRDRADTSAYLQNLQIRPWRLAVGHRPKCTVDNTDMLCADLGRNGEIFCDGLVFSTPSSFAMYLRRREHALCAEDNGWSAVKYEGTNLLELREQCGLAGHQTAQGGDKKGVHSFFGARSPGANSLRSAGGLATSSQRRPSWRVPCKSGGRRGLANGVCGDGFSQAQGRRRMRPSRKAHATRVVQSDEEDTNTSHHDDDGDDVSRKGVEKRCKPQRNGDTWILCDECDRWRRVKLVSTPDGPWYCSMNPDKRWASYCDKRSSKRQISGLKAVLPMHAKLS